MSHPPGTFTQYLSRLRPSYSFSESGKCQNSLCRRVIKSSGNTVRVVQASKAKTTGTRAPTEERQHLVMFGSHGNGCDLTHQVRYQLPTHFSYDRGVPRIRAMQSTELVLCPFSFGGVALSLRLALLRFLLILTASCFITESRKRKELLLHDEEEACERSHPDILRPLLAHLKLALSSPSL